MRPVFVLDQAMTSIQALRDEGTQEITSIGLIEHLFLRYSVDRGVPVAASPNAAFGRALSRCRDALGIVLARKRVRGVDADGRRTTTTLWRLGV